MSDERRHGYPPRYVLLKVLVLPADLAYVDDVQATQQIRSRNETVRHILKEAREARRFLRKPPEGAQP